MKRIGEGRNLMGGCKKKGNSSLGGDKNYANDLNEFYARFDCHDFEKEMNDRFKNMEREEEAEKIQLRENKVLCNLKKMKIGKAPGPDTLLPCVVMNCANQLRSFVIFSICH